MKQQGRKPPKRRQSARPKLDADMRELMTVLAENKLDDFDAQFEAPWRDGWNAVALLFEEAIACGIARAPEGLGWSAQLTLWITDRLVSPDVYRQAELMEVEALRALITMPSSVDMYGMRAIALAARCAQLVVANTSAGGHAFNPLLKRFYSTVVSDDNELWRIRKHRCNDAVGAEREDHANARERRAFNIAWERGLYRAAYAIKGT